MTLLQKMKQSDSLEEMEKLVNENHKMKKELYKRQVHNDKPFFHTTDQFSSYSTLEFVTNDIKILI